MSNLATEAQTKIVATVGPASRSEARLLALIGAGVDVFRLNMAHGTREEHETAIARIRAASEQAGQVAAILVDLAGPKIRLGELVEDPLECPDGRRFRFVRGETSHHPDEFVTTYAGLVDELDVGDHVVLADGTVDMQVRRKEADFAEVEVVQAGELRSRQGVNLPGVKLTARALTEEDRDNAQWALEQEVDYLGMSFVRSASEVQELKDLLASHAGHRPMIVAKIEKREALDDLDAIVRTADAIMVARGDLGVETDVAHLAVRQKQIIATCMRYQRPVVTATQMLDSMQHSKHPTRAEATDVANAILDGTDACMLSGESAVGKYPVKSVEMMNRIALATEPAMQELPDRALPEFRPKELAEITQMVAHSAGEIAERLGAKFIVVGSHSGATALALSAQRRLVPIVGVSDSAATLRRMCLYWGVKPLPGIPTGDDTTLLEAIVRWGREQGHLTPGDRIVLVASNHLAARGHNVVMVHEVE